MYSYHNVVGFGCDKFACGYKPLWSNKKSHWSIVRGDVWGIIGENPSVSKFNLLRVVIFQVFFDN